MIFLYMALIVCLSIYDIWDLKKKGQIKDIYVYSGCMVLVAIIGVVYLSDTFRPSIVSYFLKIFNVKG